VPVDETIGNEQEVTDVDTQEAFETLLGELLHAFERTQESIEVAMKKSDFSAIRKAAGRGETIQDQIDHLRGLQEQWEGIVGAEGGRGPKRAPPGASTPQEAFRMPILRALDEMGGQGRTAEVVDRVGEIMKDQFTEWDLKAVPSGGDIRWRNKANWARSAMVNDGLLASDSPRGIWEITEKGRNLLRERRRR
jgi:hypothetical protein